MFEGYVMLLAGKFFFKRVYIIAIGLKGAIVFEASPRRRGMLECLGNAGATTCTGMAST
jgi:hypothetical protein